MSENWIIKDKKIIEKIKDYMNNTKLNDENHQNFLIEIKNLIRNRNKTIQIAMVCEVDISSLGEDDNTQINNLFDKLISNSFSYGKFYELCETSLYFKLISDTIKEYFSDYIKEMEKNEMFDKLKEVIKEFVFQDYPNKKLSECSPHIQKFIKYQIMIDKYAFNKLSMYLNKKDHNLIYFEIQNSTFKQLLEVFKEIESELLMNRINSFLQKFDNEKLCEIYENQFNEICKKEFASKGTIRVSYYIENFVKEEGIVDELSSELDVLNDENLNYNGKVKYLFEYLYNSCEKIGNIIEKIYKITKDDKFLKLVFFHIIEGDFNSNSMYDEIKLKQKPRGLYLIKKEIKEKKLYYQLAAHFGIWRKKIEKDPTELLFNKLEVLSIGFDRLYLQLIQMNAFSVSNEIEKIIFNK